MDIKITDKAIRHFLKSQATPAELAEKISLCGPTFDKIKKLDGDYLYEIEIITNRIDVASAQGIARESSSILNQMGIKADLVNDPYQKKIDLYSNLPKTINFEIEAAALVPRFTAVILENVNINDSPAETKSLLTACGERPINNAVDITNELTLLYGMPSHIFDLDKLAVQRLIIRESKKDEEVVTLDDQKNKLKGGDLVIEDGTGKLVDLCGIMGGQIAEVDQHTKNILLIVPVYDPSRIRKSSLYLQKRTLAAQVYEKQPDTQLTLPVLTRAIELFKERTGARVASAIFDSNPTLPKAKTIDLDIKWANGLIGVDIPEITIISILKSLGFTVAKTANILSCSIPSWRRYDVNIREDLVEEIARIYGYFKLPPKLPYVNLSPETKSQLLTVESKIKNFLSSQGFNEIYNSSLISLDLIKATGLNEAKHLKLTNALSEDYAFLRTFLSPSLLQNLRNNQGKSEEPYYLFELSNIYDPIDEKLPREVSHLATVITIDFRLAKGYLELLFSHLRLNSIEIKSNHNLPSFFAEETSAVITSGKDIIGFIGTIKPLILNQMGITSNPIVVEIDVEIMASLIPDNLVYHPISEFPGVVEQMTISSNETIGEIIDKIKNSHELVSSVEYLNSFKNNHTFKITFSSFKNNLTQTEVNKVKTEITALFNSLKSE